MLDTLKLHEDLDLRRVEAAMKKLPNDPHSVTDKYFPRGVDVMKHRGLNPWLAYQLFVRRTSSHPAKNRFAGQYWVIAALARYTDFFKNGGRIYSIPEGDNYESGESAIVIEGYAVDCFWLETLYLSQVSGEVTAVNEGITEPDFHLWAQRCREVVQAAQVPMIYMGTRHYYWWLEKRLSQIARDSGFLGASTDVGSTEEHGSGMGTIPHALECVFAAEYGYENAVVESAAAFNEVFGPQGVPTIALIDFRNKELEDTQRCIARLGDQLWGVRMDTHGGVVPQGGIPALATREPDTNSDEYQRWTEEGLYLPPAKDPIGPYWYGNGVTLTGGYRIREILKEAGTGTKLLPTSGFGDPRKIWAWRDAQDILDVKLMDASGAGELSDKSRGGRFATSDIFAVGTGPNDLRPIHKVGRPPKPNPKLRLVAGDGDPRTPYERMETLEMEV